MPGEGILQLVAIGAKDIYLTGNPQITHFKVVYRRHNNFAMQYIEQEYRGYATLGEKITCDINKEGDLLHQVYLEFDLLQSSKWSASCTNDSNFLIKGDCLSSTDVSNTSTAYGYGLIDYIEVEIGGQIIDKHYGEWMAIWSDLTSTIDKGIMLNRMMPANLIPSSTTCGKNLIRNYIPLQFWFCTNPGLAIPLINLQYQKVRLNIKFTNRTNTFCNNIESFRIFCNYIFVDTDEKRRFAYNNHEYLIEQTQYSNELHFGTFRLGCNTITQHHKLRFNHPIKEILWVLVNKCCN